MVSRFLEYNIVDDGDSGSSISGSDKEHITLQPVLYCFLSALCLSTSLKSFDIIDFLTGRASGLKISCTSSPQTSVFQRPVGQPGLTLSVLQQ